MPINWNIPIMPKKAPKYTNVVLAFIDILGFSAAVNSNLSKPSSKTWKMIYEIFETTRTSRRTENRTGVISARLISDSIILWGEAHQITFGFICELAMEMEEVAFKHGFLIRGAVVSGKHFIERPIVANILDGTCISEDEIMLSPALALAVSEEKARKNPGIVLHASVKKYIIQKRGKKPKKNNFQVHPFSRDGLYLVEADINNKPSILSSKDRRDALNDLKRSRKIIEKGLKDSSKNKKAYLKWKFMAKHFNKMSEQVTKRIGSESQELVTL